MYIIWKIFRLVCFGGTLSRGTKSPSSITEVVPFCNLSIHVSSELSKRVVFSSCRRTEEEALKCRQWPEGWLNGRNFTLLCLEAADCKLTRPILRPLCYRNFGKIVAELVESSLKYMKIGTAI